MRKFAVRICCKDYPIFARIAEDMGYHWAEQKVEGGKLKPTQYNPIEDGCDEDSKISLVFGYFPQDSNRLGWCYDPDYIGKEYKEISLIEFVEKFGDYQEVETEEISIYQLME